MNINIFDVFQEEDIYKIFRVWYKMGLSMQGG